MITFPAATGILSGIVAVINGFLFSFLEGRQQKLELGGSGMAMVGKNQENEQQLKNMVGDAWAAALCPELASMVGNA